MRFVFRDNCRLSSGGGPRRWQENYSMAMYVAGINYNCIMGLDYLKAHEAVIGLIQGVLVVRGTIVKGMYKYAEGTPIRTHKVRLVNDCHLFLNSAWREKNPLSTGNRGTMLKVKMKEDLQKLKSNSGKRKSNQFCDILITRLPDHVGDMFRRIGEELSNDQLLMVYSLLISREMLFS